MFHWLWGLGNQFLLVMINIKAIFILSYLNQPDGNMETIKLQMFRKASYGNHFSMLQLFLDRINAPIVGIGHCLFAHYNYSLFS